MADKILKEKRKLFIHSVGEGTINGLLDELLEKMVLNEEEMEKVKRENATVMDKARALFDSVIRKGARACQVCITYICEEDCHLAEKLGLSAGQTSGHHLSMQDSSEVLPSFPAPQAVLNKQITLTSSGSEGNIKLCSPKEAERIQKEQLGEIYPTMNESSRTRVALIICNEEFDSLPIRTGAEVDIIGMSMLLKNLGYSVDVKKNLTASEMTTELEAFAHRPEHKTSDSTFLVFMSHGTREGICGKKYSEQVPDILQVNEIFRNLNTRNCPSLKDKPKVIIIQACRGENEGVVWLKDSGGVSGNTSLPTTEGFEDDAIRKAHIEKDFIAFCSSTPDNVSWRHPTKGSVFIMRLIEHLQEYACSCDVEEIFRKVRLSFEQTAGRVQMPTTERVTLTRRFYLFPGC
ncbi:caspase-1 isoform X2 [Sapajus apella]|uniref:Caspase-1 n=1 Tax=Sapajus apella TaxID=9515 RepID=A0A6J3IHJ2_SAPAP|nr:caspase-1 isoform X2 [Sapajus apella]